jgi:hypothetical protein
MIFFSHTCECHKKTDINNVQHFKRCMESFQIMNLEIMNEILPLPNPEEKENVPI